MTLRDRVYKPAFSSTGGLFRFSLTLNHQLIDVLFLNAVGFRISQHATMRNTRPIQQCFKFTLLALSHLFWVIRGSAIDVALS